jgi:hypothetical protein
MKHDELPSRRALYWPRVPYSLSTSEPFLSLRRAIDAYHAWSADHKAPSDNDLAAQLADRVAAVADAGQPCARYGANGIYSRRAELGLPFDSMSYKRIQSIARLALAAGLMVRTQPRLLVGP